MNENKNLNLIANQNNEENLVEKSTLNYGVAKSIITVNKKDEGIRSFNNNYTNIFKINSPRNERVVDIIGPIKEYSNNNPLSQRNYIKNDSSDCQTIIVHPRIKLLFDNKNRFRSHIISKYNIDNETNKPLIIKLNKK